MVLNPLVSLFGRLVARSGRIRGTGQTDGRTDGRTDRPTLAAHARRGLGHINPQFKQTSFDVTDCSNDRRPRCVPTSGGITTHSAIIDNPLPIIALCICDTTLVGMV